MKKVYLKDLKPDEVNMNDLTEKWKKKQLKRGIYYYVKTKCGNILIDCINYDRPNHDGFLYDVEEVLTPVPTYKELQTLKEYEKTIQSFNGMQIDYTIACETVNKLLDEKGELKQKNHILTESQMKLENTIGELGKENERLKELLKECHD